MIAGQSLTAGTAGQASSGTWRHGNGWWAIVLGLLLTLPTGCASMISKQQPIDRPAVTREQAEWWAANRHNRKYFPGKGWYIEGQPGFFDDDGRQITNDFIHDPSFDKRDSGLFDRLAPKTVWSQTKSVFGKGPNESAARQLVQEGDDLFRRRDFAAAAKKYHAAYKRFPDSPLEEEAIFKCGESYFFADRYQKANDQYGLLVKKFSSTQYMSQVVTRRFSIGRYWEQHDNENHHWPLTPNLVDKTRPLFDTLGHAMKVYERIRLDDPTGLLADDSIMATANAHFSRGRWEDADYHYGLIRTEYPRSEFQYLAHYLGLHCKMLQYQGPGYEIAPLEDADRLALQLLTQFPNELGSKRDEVSQYRVAIREQRAQREWDRAEYYAKNEHYASARVYWAKLAKEFPDTQVAQQARTQLDETHGLPDHPTPPFQFIVDMFPDSTRDGPVLPKDIAPRDVRTASGDSTYRGQSQHPR